MADDIDHTVDAEREPEAVRAAPQSLLTVPFMLCLTALLLYFAFQTLQLMAERGNLTAVKSSQESAIQEAQKVQAQFKALVAKTSELADQGHAGAKMVMEELFKRGIGSVPQGAPPETKAPAKAETKPAK